MRTLLSWGALTRSTPTPRSQSWNYSRHTPTLPSSLTVTRTVSSVWKCRVNRGGAALLLLHRLGWSLTHAPGAPHAALGAFTVSTALEVPIARHNAAHTAPLSFLAHVADRLSYHLGADPGYTGLITRNPVNPGPECFTHWGRMFPYTLGELDKRLPKGKPPSRRLTGIGRNCDLFRSIVSEVFRPRWAPVLEAQGWSEAWLDHVRAQNLAMFADSFLPDSECRSIAKSCYRYWTRHYSPERFSDIQRARMGKRWHNEYAFDFNRQAADVRELKAWGLKQVTIGAVVGLSQSQVSRILSPGL